MTSKVASLLAYHPTLHPSEGHRFTSSKKHHKTGNMAATAAAKRPFDPEDLTQRLMEVMAEREADEAARQRARHVIVFSPPQQQPPAPSATSSSSLTFDMAGSNSVNVDSNPRQLPDLIESEEPETSDDNNSTKTKEPVNDNASSSSEGSNSSSSPITGTDPGTGTGTDENLKHSQGFAAARARKARSLQIGSGFENFTWDPKPRTGKDSSAVATAVAAATTTATAAGGAVPPTLRIDTDTIGPLHSEALRSPSFLGTGTGSSRRASVNVASISHIKSPASRTGATSSKRASTDFHYVPQHAAAQFAATATPSSMLKDPVAREQSRRASMQVLCEPEQPAQSTSALNSRRRSSAWASQGGWEGVQEPTIFESTPIAARGSGATGVSWTNQSAEAKKLYRRTMMEAPPRRMSAQDAPLSSRRMSAGDLFDARANPRAGVETELPIEEAQKPSKRTSSGLNYFEVLKDHQVDWTQADEGVVKERRSSRFLRKLGLGRKHSHDHSEDGSEEASEPSRTGSATLAVPDGAISPLKSPKSPRFKALWRFRSSHAKED